MPTVGIRELKNKLSAYLEEVEHGARFTVTNRGKIVAILAPPTRYEPAQDLAALVKEEAASWSGGKPAGAKKPLKIKGKSISETVLEERR